MSTPRILLVQSDPDTASVLLEALPRRGFAVHAVSSNQAATQALSEGSWDVVVADAHSEGINGIELCRHVSENRPEVPVVVITGDSNLDTAVAASRAGAYDFITRPIAVDSLLLTLQRASNHQKLQHEVRRLRAAVEHRDRLSNIVGDSPAIYNVFDLIERVSDSDASVLITGESGTGKELVARAIHSRSSRKDAPFIAVNCAAMPASLLESELFGHVRGAFTDAKQSRPGLFLQASGGTLFLDEVGELPLEMQPKLLRALQERTVRPVGGDTEVSFETRLITATNRDLESEVEASRFRSDLYYRINVVQISLPPLRSRRNDILPLAQHFLTKYANGCGRTITGIAAPAMQKLIDYDWPGNVRELENCIERAVAMTRGTEIGLEDLPDKLREHKANRLVVGGDNLTELMTLEELEHRYIQHVLSAVGGNKTQAARVLGLDRRSLYRRLERPAGDKAEAKNQNPGR